MNDAAHFLFIVGTLSAILITVLIIRAMLPKFFCWFRKTAFPVPKVIASTVSLVFLAFFVVSKDFLPNSFYSQSSPLQSPYTALYSPSSATLNAATNALSPAQYRAGFALTTVTNVMHDFTAPTNAVFCDLGSGVHDEAYWIPVSFNPEGTATNSRWGRAVCAAPSGMVLLDEFPDRLAPSLPDLSGTVTNHILSVLQTPSGLLPPAGQLWYAPTTNGSFLITWHKVFLGRETNAIADLQLELFQSGDFIYRLHLDENADASSVTNWLIAAQDNGGGEVFAFAENIHLPQLESDPFSLVAATNLIPSGISLSPQTLELRWTSFGNLNPNLSDNDGDSLRDWDELYIHHTDPGNADTDADGLIDSFELSSGCDPLDPDSDNDGIADGIDPQPLVWNDADDDSDGDGLDLVFELLHGLNPATNDGIDSDGDGWADWKEILAGTNPNGSYSTPLNDDGSCKIFDVTVTLNTPISRYVVVKVGDRSMMLTPTSPSCTLTLRQGIAHDVSLFSANPCTISLSASVASPYAAFQNPHAVFLCNGYLPGKWAVASGMIAQPVPDIEPARICFHDKNAKHVEALISPEMPGSYLWWSDGTAFGATGKFIDLPYAGNDTVVEIAFTAEGATSARIFNREVFHCSLLEDPVGGLDPEEDPESGTGTGEPWFETYDGDGRLVTVNNDDDDASLSTDFTDTEMVIADNDLFGYYPIGHFTGQCCPCPEHQVKYADTATLISASSHLALYTDAGKTNAFTGTIHAGEKLYVEGHSESPAVGGERIVWQYTNGGETHQITNAFTVLSQRIIGDLNDNGIFDAEDKAAHASLDSSTGWIMPVSPNVLHKMLLRTDVDIPGLHVLSLSGNDAFRLYASDSTNGTPLLVSGQSITNGVNSVSFLSGTETTIYIEAFTSGISTLTYSFIGTGSATGIICRASLKLTTYAIEFVSMHDTFNPANRIFNPTPKDDPPAIPSNKLYLVESPDLNCYQAGLEISCEPSALLNRIVAAVYFEGNKLDLTDTLFLPDGTTTLVFSDAKLGIEPTDYEVKVGFDSNGNHLLDEGEIHPEFFVRNPSTGATIGPSIIRGSDADKYDDSIFSLSAGGYINSVNTPYASALLKIFMDGNTNGLALSKQPTSSATHSFNAFGGYLSEWLTHNAGAPFIPDGVADMPEHQWDNATEFADLVAESPQIEDPITDYYNDVIYGEVTNAFSNLAFGATLVFPSANGNYDVPHTSLSPPWVTGSTVEFNAGSLIPAPLDDLFSAIARARIVSHKVRYTVEKQHSILWGDRLVVTGVQSWGEIEDLYDFNQEAGQLSEWGATVQLGYGNGSTSAYRNAGQIYRTRIIFNKTYEGLP